MVDLNGRYDTDAQPSSFDQLPAGEYEAKIVASEVQEISSRNSLGRCLSLTWQATSGEFHGRQFWQRLNLWAENMNNVGKVKEIANQQFSGVRQATGRGVVKNSDELHHITCIVKLGPQKNDANYTEVKSIRGTQQSNAGIGSSPSSSAAAPSNARPAAGDKPWNRASA